MSDNKQNIEFDLTRPERLRNLWRAVSALPKRYKAYGVVFAIGIAAVAGINIFAQLAPARSAALNLSPDAGTFSVGDTLQVTVTMSGHADSVTSVYGVLQYDSTKWAVDCPGSPAVPACPAVGILPPFVNGGGIESSVSEGVVRFVFGIPGATGTGTGSDVPVATVDFVAIADAPQTTAISFSAETRVMTTGADPANIFSNGNTGIYTIFAGPLTCVQQGGFVCQTGLCSGTQIPADVPAGAVCCDQVCDAVDIPRITNVNSFVNSSNVLFSWNTVVGIPGVLVEGGTCQVNYGTTPGSYPSSVSGVNSSIGNYRATLPVGGLLQDTRYFYEVSCNTPSNGTITAGEFSFFIGQVDPPLTISDVAAVNVKSSSALITWLTNLGATSQVYYGTTSCPTNFAACSGSYTTTPQDANMITSHSVPLSGLTPNTQYYFRVESCTDAGCPPDPDISKVSPEFGFFTTTGELEADANVILKVQGNRICSEWLSCQGVGDSVEVLSESGQKDNLCLGVGVCRKLDENGNCIQPVFNVPSVSQYQLTYGDPAASTVDLIRNKSGYSKPSFSWSGTSSIGEQGSINGLRHPATMSQVGESVRVLNGDFERVDIGYFPWEELQREFETTINTEKEHVTVTDESRVGNPIVTNHVLSVKGDVPVCSNPDPAACPSRFAGGVKVPLKSSLVAGEEYIISFDYFSGEARDDLRSGEGIFARLYFEVDGGISFGTLITGQEIRLDGRYNEWHHALIRLPLDEGVPTTNHWLAIEYAAAGGQEFNFKIDNVQIEPVLETGLDNLTEKTCRVYPTSNSPECNFFNFENGNEAKGWKGYCLEHDPKQPSRCLMWWPVDIVKGETDIISSGSQEVAGYAGRFPLYYCLEATGSAPYSDHLISNKVFDAVNFESLNLTLGLDYDGTSTACGATGGLFKTLLGGLIGGPFGAVLGVAFLVDGKVCVPTGGELDILDDGIDIYKDEIIDIQINDLSIDHDGDSDRDCTIIAPEIPNKANGNKGTIVFNAQNKAGWENSMESEELACEDGKRTSVNPVAYIRCDRGGNANDDNNCNIITARLDFDEQDKLRNVEVKFHDGSGRKGSGHIGPVTISYRGGRCEVIAQTVDPFGTNNAFVERLESNEYQVPEIGYQRAQDYLPYGAIVPPEPSFDPTQWDGSLDLPGNQPLYVEPPDRRGFAQPPHQARAGSAYSVAAIPGVGITQLDTGTCISGSSKGSKCTDHAQCGIDSTGALGKCAGVVQPKTMATQEFLDNLNGNNNQLTRICTAPASKAGESCTTNTSCDTTQGQCQQTNDPGICIDDDTSSILLDAGGSQIDCQDSFTCRAECANCDTIPNVICHQPSVCSPGSVNAGASCSTNADCSSGDGVCAESFPPSESKGGAAAIRRLSSLFAQSYGTWVWDQAERQYVRCVPGNPTGRCIDRSTGLGYDWNIAGDPSVATPPTVYNMRLDSDRAVLTEGFEGDTEADLTISASTVFREGFGTPVLLFNSFVDANQTPQARYSVDWRDGTITSSGNLRINDRRSFSRPFTFVHTYSCEGEGSLGWDGARNACVFKPRVQIEDNWGWCNGSVPADLGIPNTPDQWYSNDGERCNSWDIYEGEIVILPPSFTLPNQPPTAFFTATPSSGSSPLSVTFNPSGSNDADGSIVNYSWNFGDGSPVVSVPTAANQSNTYTSLTPPETWTVTLTVRDDTGDTSAPFTRQVTINPDTITLTYPTANTVIGGSGVAAASVSGVSGSYTDYSFVFEFDPALISIDGFNGTGTLSNGWSITPDLSQAGAGIARITGNIGGGSPITGPGALFNIEYSGVAQGLSSLTDVPTAVDVGFTPGSPIVNYNTGAVDVQTSSLTLQDSSARVASALQMPVAITDTTSMNITSYSLVIRYENQNPLGPDLIDATGASQAGTLTSAWGPPTVNVATPGEITVSGSGPALTGAGTLVNLDFNTLVDTGTADITWGSATINGSPAPTTLNAGEIVVSNNNPPTISNFQATRNPASVSEFTFSAELDDPIDDDFPINWEIDVDDDGTPEFSGSEPGPTGPVTIITPAHTYSIPPRVFTARLTITDNIGVPSVSETITVTADWWNANWGRRRKLVLNNAGRGQLTDFPLRVSLTNIASNYPETETDGSDIRFVDSTSPGNVLAHEIEIWDDATGDSHLWVKVPVIPAGSTTDHIWVYYDYIGTPPMTPLPPAPEEVWSNGYVAVWHMDDARDSTSFANHGLPDIIATGKLGQIGRGQEFINDGPTTDRDYMDVADNASLDFTGDFTLETWVNPTTFGSNNSFGRFVGKQPPTDTAPFNLYALEWGSSQNVRFNLGIGVVQRRIDTAATLPIGSWSYVVGTRSGSSMRAYINATEDTNSPITASGALSTNDVDLRLGNNRNLPNTQQYEGYLDEVRISNVGRSADWIDAQYSSMQNTMIDWGLATVEVAAANSGTRIAGAKVERKGPAMFNPLTPLLNAYHYVISTIRR